MVAMNRDRSALTRIALSAVLIFSVAFGGSITAQSSLDQIAIQIVSDRHGIPAEELQVANTAEATYPLQGQKGFGYKIENKSDASLYAVMLDSSGAELDPVQLEERERSVYAAIYGRLDPALADVLSTAPPDQPIDVVIWLNEPPYAGPDRPAITDDPNAQKPSESEIDSIYQEVDARRAAFVEPIVAPVARRLEGFGQVADKDQHVPALYASLTRDIIFEVDKWPEVDRIYLAPTAVAELATAGPTIMSNVVHGRGINGAGVRVAQIEVGGRVSAANPFLAGTVQSPFFVCAAPSGHSTAVAGIIRSTHAVHRGTAPGVALWAGGSCAGNIAQLTASSNMAVGWNARALNLSWGANIGLVPGPLDRFYDNIVLNQWRTVVKSAGNEGAPCGATGNVTSPGLAYNIITVGNFNDRPNGSNWAGDVMGPCSSWRNPASTVGDREKPEVAAPGTSFTSTTLANPWVGPVGSGTSYAAPMVTGEAALLIQRNAFLSVWPETLKSIVMATAVHNIEGNSRLSQFDGAGGVVLDRADDVAGGVTGGFGGMGYNCAAPVNLNIATVWMASGIRTRVVIVWDNDPAYPFYNNQPGADLDLRVIGPGNVVVASSLSWDNTYEIVEFTPTVTGFHTLRVNKFRCNFNPQWLGWAWRQGN